jgi:hypothetical protein
MITLTVEFDFETGEYVIMCASHGLRGTVPGGPRLFRGPPHPNIQWRHLNHKDAERDAQKVRKYLADLSKTKSKR